MDIQRLNMDNSWHINFAGQRMLIDPWLIGAEIDFFSWFNKQWHRTSPVPIEKIPDYDFVVITQKYPDHFHKETLSILKPSKIIAPASIKKALQKILPSAEILVFNDSPKNVFATAINIHCIKSDRKIDPIYDSLIIEDGNESIFLAPHGMTTVSKWQNLINSVPAIKLALTTFNLYQLPALLGGTVAPGMKAVKDLIKITKPQYIAATHDENKHAEGLISKVAKIEWAPAPTLLSKDPILENRFLHIDHYETITL